MYKILYKKPGAAEAIVVDQFGKTMSFASVEVAELHCQTCGLVREDLEYMMIASEDVNFVGFGKIDGATIKPVPGLEVGTPDNPIDPDLEGIGPNTDLETLSKKQLLAILKHDGKYKPAMEAPQWSKEKLRAEIVGTTMSEPESQPEGAEAEIA
jgi:hypothetical protein